MHHVEAGLLGRPLCFGAMRFVYIRDPRHARASINNVA